MTDTAAFWLGAAAAALWAYGDFHAPHRIADVQGAVPPPRYFFATALYALGAVVAFAVLASLPDAVARFAACVPDARSGASGAFGLAGFPGCVVGLGNGGGEPAALTSHPAAMAALLALLASPYLPGARGPLSALRRGAQALALFPVAAERLTALLGQAAFEPRPDARSRLEDELGRYGVPQGALRSHLSAEVFRALEEAESLRAWLEDAGDEGPLPARALAARAPALQVLSQDHRRVLRRTARMLRLTESIRRRSGPLERREAATISDAVAENCAALLRSYRRLVAEAALSSGRGPKGCRSMLAGVGYAVAVERIPVSPYLALPFWPVAASFAVVLVPLTFVPLLLPFLGAPRLEGPPPAPALDRLPLMLVASVAQAVIYAFSIALALYPKAVANFARPSLRARPWRSYLAFGAASYASGAALTAGVVWLFPALPLAKLGALGVAAVPLFSVALTVGVAALTDRHLMRPAAPVAAERWPFDVADALALAATVAAADLVIQSLLRPAPTWVWQITAVFAAIGFAIGAFVPSTAAVHLNLREATAARAVAAGRGSAARALRPVGRSAPERAAESAGTPGRAPGPAAANANDAHGLNRPEPLVAGGGVREAGG